MMVASTKERQSRCIVCYDSRRTRQKFYRHTSIVVIGRVFLFRSVGSTQISKKRVCVDEFQIVRGVPDGHPACVGAPIFPLVAAHGRLSSTTLTCLLIISSSDRPVNMFGIPIGLCDKSEGVTMGFMGKK